MGLSYASASKANTQKSVQRRDAYTQTTDVGVSATQKTSSDVENINQTSTKPCKSNQNTASNEPVEKKANTSQAHATAQRSPNRSNKSPSQVLPDRLLKGSDDQIAQFNRFGCLDDDMEAENSQTEPIVNNKQGRIIKLNNKK